jgi:hypothetical protein
VEPQELITIGYTPLVSPPNGAVSRSFSFHQLSVLLEPREYLRAVMDLQNPMNFRGLLVVGPTGFEYDTDDVLARIAIDKLRESVNDCLVLFQELGFREDFAAGCAGEDIVSERKERVIGGDIGF